MGVRLYDPRLGRFLSVDSVEGGCANDYDYVYQDPQNNLDLDRKKCNLKGGFRKKLKRIFKSRDVGIAALGLAGGLAITAGIMAAEVGAYRVAVALISAGLLARGGQPDCLCITH